MTEPHDQSTPTEPATPQSAGGPQSILTCAACGKPNKIRPSERGAPHCGNCGKPLPWLVNATDATFDVEARASPAVLVDLWAPWCGPCRVTGPILEELAREYAGRLKVVKVNVDDNQATAQRFQAFSIPTLVVIKNGRVVDRIVGAMPKGALTIRLTPHLLRT
jgi:thioredoxin 2